MYKNLLSILFFLLVTVSFAQDAAVTASVSPVSGCDLTSSEVVNVVVLNNGSSPIFSGTLTANYTVNGGTTHSQTLSTNIPGGGGNTWNCLFTDNVDLSGCDMDYVIKVWIDYAADTDPTNDTLTWTVRNDCTIVPGQVQTDATICSGNNNSVLNLTGWSHGTLTNWIYSEDNGTSWNAVANTTTSQTVTDITQTRLYAVAIDGGYCPNDTALYATLTVQPNPTAGTLAISGPDSLCITNANGAINLSGNSGTVLNWESSTDGGTTWSNIVNPTTTENFSGLTSTTLFRALVDGGVCPNVYSDTSRIYIDQATISGTLLADTVICYNSDIELKVDGSLGTKYIWGSSPDGTTWNPISSASTVDTFYQTGGLTNSTYYRVFVTNGVCNGVLTNVIQVQVQDSAVGGSIAGGTSVCASNANGTLSLSGNSGGVLGWETSTDNGTSWNANTNTSTTANFSNVTQSTMYRALVDGGACPDAYTDTAMVIVSPVTDAGLLNGIPSVCLGSPDSVSVSNNIGEVKKWQYSADGTTWVDINSTDSTVYLLSVDQPYYYRMIAQSGVCDPDTTAAFYIDTIATPTVDAGADVTIHPGDTTQLSGSGGTFGIWTPGATLSDSTIYSPLAYPTTTTTYTLYVVNLSGCYAQDDVTVTVASPYPKLDVKNIITPNGDGYNDQWFIQGWQNYSSISVHVYNIYGQEVYSNQNYKNDWGGEYKGKTLPDGTYMYVVEPKGYDGKLKGNLTILGND